MFRLEALAHDIRAPLAALEAALELLERHAEEPEAVRRHAEGMRMACLQLRELAEAMLEEAPSLREAPCTIGGIARQACALYPGQADLVLTGCCEAVMLADARAVRRILVNLIGNAVKFSPEDDRPAVRVHAQEDDGYIAVRAVVTDRGIGMSEKTLAHLFEPRMRGEEAAGIPGHGLGLSGAQTLACAMGASLQARSCLGEGSEFTFEGRFPAVRTDALAGKRFLIAEDHALARDALCELLEEAGALAESAQDGAAAVRLFAARPVGWFHAALMDLQMPGMDGLQAAHAIRAMDRADAAEIAIVALTGDAAGWVQAKGCGIDACALKPIRLFELAATLERVRTSRKNR